MQEPNGTQSPRSLVGFSLGLVLLGAVIAWPEAALAGQVVTNSYYDSDAAEGDIVDVCEMLEIEESGVLGGRCNKKGPKNSIMVVYDDIDLSPDIDDTCASFKLVVNADGITMSAVCDPGPEGKIVHAEAKLDDMIGWNTETGQFYGKDEDLKGQ